MKTHMNKRSAITKHSTMPERLGGLLLGATLLVELLIAPAAAADGTSAGRMFIYPSKGQPQAQLDKDRYECHVWAREQTGYDPSAGTAAPPPPPAAVPVPVPQNPHAGAAAAGTVTGAVLGGAIGAHHHDTLAGAIVGATIGAIAGGSIETEGRVEARREAEAQANREAARRSDTAHADDGKRVDYRRAIAACLEGRGYTVR